MVTIRSKDEPWERTHWKDGIEHHEILQCVLLHESPAETLVGADLHGLVLTCADLADADLREADLSKATLTSATFRRANLAGTKCIHADMVFADFTGANLTGTDFRHAALCWADFSDCDMTQADFEGAHLDFMFHNENTIWPQGITPELVRAKRHDDPPPPPPRPWIPKERHEPSG